MRLIDALRGVIIPYPTTSDYTDVGAGMLQTYYGGQNSTGERINSDFKSYASTGYAGNGVVFSVLNARMRLFTEATFKFRSLDRGKLFDSPALALLECPWPNGQTPDLLARMLQDADLAGNAFVHQVRPNVLRRLRPDWVQIVAVEIDDEVGLPYTEVIGYMYAEGGFASGEDPVYMTVDEVAHWSPIPDPLASWRGISWLTPIVREVNADLAMVTHRQKFFDNAATPNLLIRYAGSIGQTRLEDTVKQVNARHGGAVNAWKTMILDNGADVTVVGNNFKDMAFDAIQSAGEVRIASAGGVPPLVAGLQGGLDAATIANYAAAYRNFADSTVHGLWRGASNALAKLVEVPDGAQLWFDTNDIPSLRDAEESRQKANAQFAMAANSLVTGGFEAASVVNALVSGDMSQLQHTGLTSVQLLPPGRSGDQTGDVTP